MFNVDEFGEQGGAIRASDGSTTIPGIFDDEDVEVVSGEGTAVLVAQAVFTCAASKVPNPVEGELFTIDGRSLALRYWKRDGVGMIELFFEKTS